jgi:hypothetical protein
VPGVPDGRAGVAAGGVVVTRTGPDEVAAIRERMMFDTPFWSSHCCTILDDQKRTIRLRPRPWQARTALTPAHVWPLDEALEQQRAAGLPMRAIILKARKLGFSTWVQAKAMQRVTQQPFQYALTVAHLRSSASVLFDMARLMYERLPTEEELGLGFSIRPQLINVGQSRAGARWMVLGDKGRRTEASLYETLTSGTKGGGRATTPSIIHGSEVAHFEDPEYLTGLMNALPDGPETIAVLESTANGFNHFHDLWQTAVAGEEDPVTGYRYTPLFYGWQDNPSNRMEFLSEEAAARFERTIGDPDGGGDEEEEWLVDQFGVTLEQLLWRRQTRDGPKCRGKVELLHQEHPATPEQAFIGSGSPVFSGVLVQRALAVAAREPEPVLGVLRGEDWMERKTRAGMVRVPYRAVWVPHAQVSFDDRELWGDTRLRVWEHPLNEATQQGLLAPAPDGQYVVFGDVAGGEGETLEERDYHAVQVLDHLSLMQVCSYDSRIDFANYPLILLLVAVYYNSAWLAPEASGLGIGIVDRIAKDYRYPRIYRRHRAGDDQRQDARQFVLGWNTDRGTKPLMEQTMHTALKEGTHGLRCLRTGRQFTTYVEDAKNRAKHGAVRGSFDDLLVAFMGAHRVASELKPRDPSKKARRFRARDDVTGY